MKNSKKNSKISYLIITLIALFLAGFLAFNEQRTRLHLGQPAVVTGGALVAIMFFLASFNARKKLSMLPLGNAKTWLKLHVVGGFLALLFFWIHTRTLWPLGNYEQILAFLFYLLTANGIVGYILQRIYPGHLTQTGLEIIYERIPAEIVEIREHAESLILECTKETGAETLAQYYLETLDWFFRKPRFFASHAVGRQKARHWLRQQLAVVKHYLNDSERVYLAKLQVLAEMKNKVDVHYAIQTILKSWLLIHIPLTVAVVVFTVWHILLVHIYAL